MKKTLLTVMLFFVFAGLVFAATPTSRKEYITTINDQQQTIKAQKVLISQLEAKVAGLTEEIIKMYASEIVTKIADKLDTPADSKKIEALLTETITQAYYKVTELEKKIEDVKSTLVFCKNGKIVSYNMGSNTSGMNCKLKNGEIEMFPHFYSKDQIDHYRFSTIKAKKHWVQKFQDDFDKLLQELNLRNSPDYVPCPYMRVSPIKVGNAGFFRAQQKVQQVVSDRQMLIIINDQTVWIDGVSTAGLTDDSYISFDDPFYISGTKSYETAIGGTKTVFVAEPIKAAKNWDGLLANYNPFVIQPSADN